MGKKRANTKDFTDEEEDLDEREDDMDTVEITIHCGGANGVELNVELDVNLDNRQQTIRKIRDTIDMLHKAVPVEEVAERIALMCKKLPDVFTMNPDGTLDTVQSVKLLDDKKGNQK